MISSEPDGSIHIGENSLITNHTGDVAGVGGVQELYAEDANNDAIDINVTNGSDLLICFTGYQLVVKFKIMLRDIASKYLKYKITIQILGQMSLTLHLCCASMER